MIMNQISHLLTLIEHYASNQRPMTLTQISDALCIPKSTAHNLIATLTARGYLYEVRTRGGFYPSRKLFLMAEALTQGDPVTDIMHSAIQALSEKTGETALLAARDKSHVIYLDVVESQQPVRYSASVGDRRPVFATSGGKAILAEYPEAQFEKALASLDFSAAREATIRDAKTLRDNIDVGRKAGYFLNLSEFTSGVTGVGIAITVDSRVLGLSIAGPNNRMEGQHEAMAEYLRQAATEISEILTSAGVDSVHPKGPKPRARGAAKPAVSANARDTPEP